MTDWYQAIWDRTPFLVLDTETTGVRKSDTICEVSILLVEDGEVVENFHSFVNPEQHIPEDVTAIHHITDDMVVNSPLIHDLAPEINRLLNTGIPIVAHGLAFDVRMLRYCDQIALGWPSGIPTLCTMNFAKHHNPPTKELPSHKLTDLTTMFGIFREHQNMHRAEADTTALAALVPRLLRGRSVATAMTKFSEQWVK